MSNWKKLWELRNEPASVILSFGLLIIVVFLLFVSGNQYFFRKLPFACQDVILPSSKDDCSEMPSQSLVRSAALPIGTIVAFFGDANHLPKGWALCDGQNNPANSKIKFDANSERGGIQLPNLRKRFIRGAQNRLDPNQVMAGGSDSIDLEHSHLWISYKNRHWHAFDKNNRFIQIDDWNDGMHDDGKHDVYPLIAKRNMEIFTSKSGHSKVEHLPSYVEMNFIIKIY